MARLRRIETLKRGRGKRIQSPNLVLTKILNDAARERVEIVFLKTDFGCALPLQIRREKQK